MIVWLAGHSQLLRNGIAETISPSHPDAPTTALGEDHRTIPIVVAISVSVQPVEFPALGAVKLGRLFW